MSQHPITTGLGEQQHPNSLTTPRPRTDFFPVPGEAAGVADPALLLLVVAAAALAGVEVAVQALPLAVQQELEGLQAVDAVGFVEVGLVCQERPLAAFLVDLAFQLPAERPQTGGTGVRWWAVI